ncbi:type II secretion system minor pseudopilin GspI [Brevundimonas fluminis]|jgi:general secretion pathway protein I|uniref:type II secretion system minor pseudopilin GspI n=1 Tax=Brevundimonas fluminis TaxID=2487274 RepID=UPI000F65851E|nr:type II secretion system minor pseudopilin GspI [Brevundimonas fluminis]
MTGRRGFTLIELLVALAVFSLAALALLKLSGENARAAADVETRTVAAIVADNLAVQALTSVDPPAEGETAGTASMAGRDWRWRRIVTATPDPDMLRIEVKVSEDGVWTAAEAILFRGRAQ